MVTNKTFFGLMSMDISFFIVEKNIVEIIY